MSPLCRGQAEADPGSGVGGFRIDGWRTTGGRTTGFPLTGGRIDEPDPAAVSVDDRAGDGQPESGGAVLARDARGALDERLEQPLPDRGIDPIAAVGHLDLDGA